MARGEHFRIEGTGIWKDYSGGKKKQVYSFSLAESLSGKKHLAFGWWGRGGGGVGARRALLLSHGITAPPSGLQTI